MQLDNMSNTVRIFKARALNVPSVMIITFDRWTQKQFYEMAAFTEGAGNIRIRGEENINVWTFV